MDGKTCDVVCCLNVTNMSVIFWHLHTLRAIIALVLRAMRIVLHWKPWQGTTRREKKYTRENGNKTMEAFANTKCNRNWIWISSFHSLDFCVHGSYTNNYCSSIVLMAQFTIHSSYRRILCSAHIAVYNVWTIFVASSKFEEQIICTCFATVDCSSISWYSQLRIRWIYYFCLSKIGKMIGTPSLFGI